MGALQKAKEGEFMANVKGTNAVYAVRVIKKAAPTVPFTEDIYMNYVAMQNMYNVFGQQGQFPSELFNYLISRKGNVKDLRYKF